MKRGRIGQATLGYLSLVLVIEQEFVLPYLSEVILGGIDIPLAELANQNMITSEEGRQTVGGQALVIGVGLRTAEEGGNLDAVPKGGLGVDSGHGAILFHSNVSMFRSWK